MVREETQLILGRGEVYFEPFVEGTREGEGERYIGNTTTFQLARAIKSIERFTSYRGQKVAREGVVTEESHTVQFITDNISVENLGLWFGEETAASEFLGQNFITERMKVRRNRFYQLGKSHQPFGTRYVEEVSVKIDGNEILPTGNWSVNSEFGTLEIIANAPDIFDGSLIDVTFQWRSVTSETVRSQAKDLFGSMRFIATNPVGVKRHYFFPFVKLTPRGSFDLKGDEWQQIPFEAEAMRLTPNVEQVYLDHVTSVGTTDDEQAILDEGSLTLDDFPIYEDIFDISLNQAWAHAMQPD